MGAVTGSLDSAVMALVCSWPTCCATITLTHPSDGRARMREFTAAGWRFILDDSRHRPICPRCVRL